MGAINDKASSIILRLFNVNQLPALANFCIELEGRFGFTGAYGFEKRRYFTHTAADYGDRCAGWRD